VKTVRRLPCSCDSIAVSLSLPLPVLDTLSVLLSFSFFLSFFLPLSTLPLIVYGIVAKLLDLTATIEVTNSLRSGALLPDSV
jgi:hypothetical protein